MTAGPLSILHVAAPGAVGGLERVVQGLAIGHHRAGHRVRVAVFVEPERDIRAFVDPLEGAGVDTRVARLHPRAYLEERARVARLCREVRTDLLHTHGEREDVLHVGVGHRAGVPVVTTIHGSSRLGGVTHAYHVMQHALLWRFDAVVPVSQKIARALRWWGIPRRKVHLIRNAWSVPITFLDRAAARHELGVPADCLVVGFVGRLIPVKGADLFLEAFAHCRDLALQAVIVGDGATRPLLEARAAELHLKGRVTFTGTHSEAARVFRAFDVWVLSSRSEGTPNVLFEAMASSVPIVAAAVGGVPEVISSDEAVLVRPEDPEALAQGIRRVLLANDEAQQRAAAARRRLDDQFSAGQWLRSYEAVYRTVQRSSLPQEG